MFLVRLGVASLVEHAAPHQMERSALTRIPAALASCRTLGPKRPLYSWFFSFPSALLALEKGLRASLQQLPAEFSLAYEMELPPHRVP